MCLLQHYLYPIKGITVRLRASKLIMADFIFWNFCHSFFFIKFFSTAFYVLMGLAFQLGSEEVEKKQAIR